MIRRSPDLILLLAVTWLVWMLTVLDGPGILRLAAGLPLVLFFPGYAFLAAFLPRRTLGQVERLVLSIALSLAVVILTGLMLHLSDSGLSPSAWAASLAMISGPLAAAALARREAQAMAAERLPDTGRSGNGAALRPRAVRPQIARAALLLTSGILITVALLISQRPAPSEELHGYTQLWIMPSGGALPVTAVWLGLNSYEFEPRTFHLEVEAGGHPWYTFESVDLLPGETWYSLVMLPPDWDGSGALAARLYADGQPDQVYREVILQLGAHQNVSGAQTSGSAQQGGR